MMKFQNMALRIVYGWIADFEVMNDEGFRQQIDPPVEEFHRIASQMNQRLLEDELFE